MLNYNLLILQLSLLRSHDVIRYKVRKTEYKLYNEYRKYCMNIESMYEIVHWWNRIHIINKIIYKDFRVDLDKKHFEKQLYDNRESIILKYFFIVKDNITHFS